MQTILKKGGGPPLVFLHGFLGSHADFYPLVSYLGPRFCVGIDLPGHGNTPFTRDFFGTFPLFAEKIHLIGYSMGGRLALQYALKYPERIESLTLISTHPGLKTPLEKEERLKYDALWAEKMVKLPMKEFLKSWYLQPIFDGFMPDLTTRETNNPLSLKETLLFYSLGKQDYFPIENNASIFLGEKDLKFRNLYSRATIIPNAAHAVHLENPKELARRIDEQISLGLYSHFYRHQI